jgi:hypothetical protein
MPDSAARRVRLALMKPKNHPEIEPEILSEQVHDGAELNPDSEQVHDGADRPEQTAEVE